MATKREELDALAEGRGCLGNAADDEPLFILRAQDALAPDIVRSWAKRLETLVGPEHVKVQEANILASEMHAWQVASGRRKIPD